MLSAFEGLSINFSINPLMEIPSKRAKAYCPYPALVISDYPLHGAQSVDTSIDAF